MATPERLLEADYETLSYAAAALEKQQGVVSFKSLVGLEHGTTALIILNGGTVSDKDLGKFLWYIADVLEDANNRRSG